VNTMRQTNQPRNYPGAPGEASIRAGGAFTLIELLVVIAILGLLITLLLPSINAARRVAYKTKTDVRIKALSDACYLYYDDTGRRYFPGQQYPQLLTSGTCTGSELLAAAVFNIKGGGFAWSGATRNQLRGVGNGAYLGYSDEYFADYRITGSPYPALTLGDCFPPSLRRSLYLPVGDPHEVIPFVHTPILYYPARLGPANAETNPTPLSFAGGTATQFTKYWFADNDQYDTNKDGTLDIDNGQPCSLLSLTDDEKVGGDRAVTKARQWADPTANDPNPIGIITDTKLAPARQSGQPFPAGLVQPYNPDSFIIIAPGLDRKYFTSDDQKNF
jgi:prepilin-type N-terminal cleavage/methylation domain-containing protein